jgi:hypothetical protein
MPTGLLPTFTSTFPYTLWQFTRDAGGKLEFVGDWDAVQALSESNEQLGGLTKALAECKKKV